MSNQYIPTVPMSYPAGLPLPQAEPYNWVVGFGMISTKMNAGNTLIRRRWKTLPHTFNFTFQFTTAQLIIFTDFVNSVGADWFNILSLSMWTGPDNDLLDHQPVRFIGNMDVSSLGHDYWQVQIPAELSPEVVDAMAAFEGGLWYIGGYPSSPSSADWIIAGTPPSPSSTNWVIAGTPGIPSGEVT